MRRVLWAPLLPQATSTSSRVPHVRSASPRWTTAYSTTSSATTKWHSVDLLPSTTLSAFRANAFVPGIPALLPRGTFLSLPAIEKWFIPASTTRDSASQPAPAQHISHPGPLSINTPYLTPHASTLLPLELTTPDAFTRTEAAPLSLLLAYLSTATPLTSTRLYLAQAPLSSLPAPLRADFPTPDLVAGAGKGDVYTTSLWIGMAPTSTPLHRDPNPNLLVQIAGTKKVRLLDPAKGKEVLARVRAKGCDAEMGSSSSKVRGEEMMVGAERRRLEEVVWGDVDGDADQRGERAIDSRDSAYADPHIEEGLEATLHAGDGLFIPTGYWHSIRGVGAGVTGSVNWWFR